MDANKAWKWLGGAKETADSASKRIGALLVKVEQQGGGTGATGGLGATVGAGAGVIRDDTD